MSDEGYQIRDAAALGKPMEFLREKIEPELNDIMKALLKSSTDRGAS